MKFESRILNEDIRTRAPGNFLKLKQGFVHYQLEGPENGELIILVHGFSSPMVVWDKNYDFLVDRGYRVLRFDLFGRGFSDRPKAIYDLNFFIRQLAGVLSVLKIRDTKFNLIGLSMGGAIAVVMAERYPNLIRKLILVDPAGMPGEIRKTPSILRIPLLNKLVFHLIGLPLLIKGMPNDFHSFESFPEYRAKYTGQMEYKGYRNAILSSILNFPMTALEKSYQAVGKLNLPVQLFWGENDNTIPYVMHRDVLNAISNLKFESIKDCGHMPQYEKADLFNERLLQFLHSM